MYIQYHIQTVRAQNLSAKGYTGSCNWCGEGGWSGQGISYGENVTGFTPDLSEAESKNSVGIVVDFKAGDKKYTSKQNFTMRNKVPTGADVEYVAPART